MLNVKRRDNNPYQLGLNFSGKNHFRFADDMILFEENSNNLETHDSTSKQRKCHCRIIQEYRKNKTANQLQKSKINVDAKKLEYVDNCTYLGQIISPQDQTIREINTRIACGWRKYLSLNEIMKSRDLGIRKRKSFQHLHILPCNIYIVKHGQSKNKTQTLKPM